MKKKAVGALAGLLMVAGLAPPASSSAADQTVVIPIPGTGCVVEIFVTTRYPLSSYAEIRCPR